MSVSIMVSKINLDGLGDNLIREMRSDGDFEYDFDISPELFDDFQNRNITLENYNDILGFIANQLLCKDATNILNQCVNLFGTAVIHTIPKEIYKQLDARLIDKKFDCVGPLRLAIIEWQTDNKNTFKIYGHLSFWDVSDVTNMDGLFRNTTIDVPLNNWDVSNVVSMKGIFRDSRYNFPLNKWDVSNVEDMSYMFKNARYNCDLNKWNVSNVTNMEFMFHEARYNNPLNDWDVSNVTNMIAMFMYSKYNHPLDNWKLNDKIKIGNMFYNSEICFMFRDKFMMKISNKQ